MGGAAITPDGTFDAVDVGTELGERGEVLGTGDAVVVEGGQGAIVAEEFFGGREVNATRETLVVVWGVGFVSC